MPTDRARSVNSAARSSLSVNPGAPPPLPFFVDPTPLPLRCLVAPAPVPVPVPVARGAARECVGATPAALAAVVALRRASRGLLLVRERGEEVETEAEAESVTPSFSEDEADASSPEAGAPRQPVGNSSNVM